MIVKKHQFDQGITCSAMCRGSSSTLCVKKRHIRDIHYLRLSIKHLKHISSYLTPESWKRIKMVATEREQHDYEILQDAVDLYFANLDRTEE